MIKYRKSSLYDIMVVVVLAFFILLIMLLPGDNSSYKSNVSTNLRRFDEGWFTEDNRPIALKEVGKYAELNNNGDYELTIKKDIPTKLIGDTTLNFRAKNLKYQAIIEGRVVQDFTPEHKIALSKGNGNSFHRLYIKNAYAGKLLKLKVFPAHNSKSGFINEMYIGRDSDYFSMIIDKNIIGFLLCLFMFFGGIILFCLSFIGRKVGRYSNAQKSLGVIGILVGSWSMFETTIIQLLFGYSFQIHEICYILQLFMPYAFVSYVYQTLKKVSITIIRVSFATTMLVFATMLVLNFFGIDFHETLWLIHVVIIIDVLLITFYSIKSVKYCINNNIKIKKAPQIIAVGFFMICAVLDLSNYWFGRGNEDASRFIRVGIFVGLSVLAVDSTLNLFTEIKKADKAEVMRKLAYTDALTGIPNRAAFEEKEEELSRKIEDGSIKEVLICQFDLNDLKKVNDTYGHAYGDKYIIASANMINKAFGKVGFAFRVGGDEFTVFVIGNSTEYIYEKSIVEFKKLEDEYNNSGELPITINIAYGHVVYTKDSYESLEKAEMRADKSMYKLKELIKKGERQ